MNPMLSIIVPVYNTKEYIPCCINSLLNMNYKDYEIILVDDESPDNAGTLCDEYSLKYPFIFTIHKKNEGLGMARNTGLENSKGKYIAFLDSDDFVKPDFYQELIECCEKNAADICYAGGIINYKDNIEQYIDFEISQNMLENESIVLNATRIISAKPKKNDGLPGSSCLAVYSKKFLNNSGIKFVSERSIISEDIWFNMDCYIKAKKIAYSEIIGYCYRYNDTSLSRKYNPNRFNMLIESERMLLERCSNDNLSEYEERVAIHFWSNFEKCLNQEVRYNDRPVELIYRSIKNMCLNEYASVLIAVLCKKRLLVGSHQFLCLLSKRGMYLSIVLLLKLYNLTKRG